LDSNIASALTTISTGKISGDEKYCSPFFVTAWLQLMIVPVYKNARHFSTGISTGSLANKKCTGTSINNAIVEKKEEKKRGKVLVLFCVVRGTGLSIVRWCQVPVPVLI
jgi:hypothetical protein